MANGRIRPLWPVLLSILLALLVSGCSDSNENSGLSLVDEQGNHPSNFISTHPGFAVAEINQCTPCHGDDLTGGISKQSCFLSACHHGTEVGWVVFPSGPPQGHGNSAKAAPSTGEGYPACQICHATDFTGGGAQVTCLSASCHGGPGTSPHPSQWRSVDTYVHTNTNEENASVCAQCHLNGANSPIGAPSPPAPAGTPPGCFNSTLCHGDAVPAGTHGTGWLDFDNSAAFHGSFVTSLTCETAACHPISGHPTCTSCHFDDQGSRAYTPLGFTHNASVFTNHRDGDLASDAGTICENCHQTSRTFRAGSPPSCAPGGSNHPDNDGCHYNDPLLDPVLTNPRF
ncbi:MAG: hypothetical protein WBB46_12490 [Candidatus Deferrimicrobiaceae bacterium]